MYFDSMLRAPVDEIRAHEVLKVLVLKSLRPSMKHIKNTKKFKVRFLRTGDEQQNTSRIAEVEAGNWAQCISNLTIHRTTTPNQTMQLQILKRI